jgi:hydrogenase small subunit
MAEETVYRRLLAKGLTRRDFLKACGGLAAVMGMQGASTTGAGAASRLLSGRARSADPAHLIARALATKARVPVIWLELQDCAGCTEALTRSHNPTLVDLVLNEIAIEYHETLAAAAGHQVEEAKQAAMKRYAGQYVLVVEGSIPEDGAFCAIGGRSAMDHLKEAAAGAAAIVATGNCAAFGGLPRANPNPTAALGVADIIKDKPVVNIPGCPAIPEAFTGALAHFLILGTLPELDELGRPKAYYGQTVHDRCLRRPFYEAGKFALTFDDEGARSGWCLYKLGCKGPTTYNACASMKWDGGLSFPIQSGHPCLGCSQPAFWDGGGFYQGQSAPVARPAAVPLVAAAAIGLAAGAGMAYANRSAIAAAHAGIAAGEAGTHAGATTAAVAAEDKSKEA